MIGVDSRMYFLEALGRGTTKMNYIFKAPNDVSLSYCHPHRHIHTLLLARPLQRPQPFRRRVKVEEANV